MIRLTRTSEMVRGQHDDADVFIDPSQIAVVVEDRGETLAVMRGGDLIYRVRETRLQVLELRAAWSNRHSVIGDGVSIYGEINAEGDIVFVCEG